MSVSLYTVDLRFLFSAGVESNAFFCVVHFEMLSRSPQLSRVERFTVTFLPAQTSSLWPFFSDLSHQKDISTHRTDAHWTNFVMHSRECSVWKSQEISNSWNTEISLRGTNYHAMVKVNLITNIEHSDDCINRRIKYIKRTGVQLPLIKWPEYRSGNS